MKKVTNCVVCGKQLKGRQGLYCSARCKNQVHQSYKAQKARGLMRKLEIVERMGGKCSLCGYKKNLSALTLHHNRGQKDFQLDMRTLSNRTHVRIEEELKKCILLCHNCHAEIHSPDLDLAKLLVKPTALTTELRARR